MIIESGLIDVNEDSLPLETEYALINAGRLAGHDLVIQGAPRVGETRHLPMQNFPHVRYALIFYSPE